MPTKSKNQELVVITESQRSNLRKLVARYAAEMTSRHTQLLADRALYQEKVTDLEQLDPLDFTGLGSLYRNHLSRIEALLSETSRAA